MIHSTDRSAAGNDKSVICVEEDRYGFHELAVKLAGNIIQLDNRICTVNGIEGRWGSGKIDDLDRLEPAQAVEVLRLIRSVADFSGFHYVLCYDPVVLGHAVEQGLRVADGRHYLQKIIPLSFNMPRPEAFDLRKEFLRGALELYVKVHNAEPDQALYYDLKEVAGTFGATLRTPRDVSHVLGSLAFRYAGIRDNVWFPDLCLLELLRVTLPDLYDWTEHYLTEHAVVASGEGSLSDKEEQLMEGTLSKVLEELPAVSPLSVMKLRRWLPGIGGVNEASPNYESC